MPATPNTNKPNAVWKVVEIQNGNVMTTFAKWRGSRALPTKKRIVSEPFTRVKNGREVSYRGFHVYGSLEQARQELQLRALARGGRRYAIYSGQGWGMFVSPITQGMLMCLELKLIRKEEEVVQVS